MFKTVNWRGFALMDLVVTIALGGLCLAVLLPLAQQNREAARLEACNNRIRQLGIAVHRYADARKQLPMAALSYPGTIKKDQWTDKNNSAYWLSHQWTSTVASIAGHMDLKSLVELIDPFNFDVDSSCADNPDYETFADIKGFYDLVYARVPHFLCPADAREIHTRQVISVLPTYEQDLGDPNDDQPWYTYWMGWQDEDAYSNTDLPGRSSYVACAGVNFGGMNRPDPVAAYRGMLGLRELTTLEMIGKLDGASNTIMLGESIGEVNLQKYLPVKHPDYDPDGTEPVRRLTQTWSQGCFVRGRGDIDWGAEPAIGNSGDPEDRMLGNGRFADLKGFSSMHTAGVVVVMGDGATKTLPRNINWKTWYALCGSRDGQTVDLTQLGPNPPIKRESNDPVPNDAPQAGSKSESGDGNP